MVIFDRLFSVIVFVVFLYLLYKMVRGVWGAPKTVTDSEWKKNSKKQAIQMLAEDIENAKKSVHIVSGNCDSEIYGNDRVMRAFQKTNAANPELDICIFTGPLDLKWGSSDRERFEKYVKIVTTDKPTGPHFRIVDKGTRLYVESNRHQHTTDAHVYKRSFNNSMAGALLEQKFCHAIEENIL